MIDLVLRPISEDIVMDIWKDTDANTGNHSSILNLSSSMGLLNHFCLTDPL